MGRPVLRVASPTSRFSANGRPFEPVEPFIDGCYGCFRDSDTTCAGSLEVKGSRCLWANSKHTTLKASIVIRVGWLTSFEVGSHAYIAEETRAAGGLRLPDGKHDRSV